MNMEVRENRIGLTKRLFFNIGSVSIKWFSGAFSNEPHPIFGICSTTWKELSKEPGRNAHNTDVDNTTRLDEHVVNRCRYRAGANAVRVSRSPCYEDRMNVWESYQSCSNVIAVDSGIKQPTCDQSDYGIICPLGGLFVESIQHDEQRQSPELQSHRHQGPRVDYFAQPNEDE
jgi:hypothetical protein